MLPKIVASSDAAAFGIDVSDGMPVCGVLGDQQAALVGQACFDPGESKNTYGTGCFMLLNTGAKPVQSKCGSADDGRVSTRRFAGDLCAGRFDRGHRVAGAVAARQSRDHPALAGRRSPGRERARQRRGVFRAGVFGTFRAVLAVRCRGVIVGLTRFTTAATSRGRRWKRRRFRRATSSTRWPATAA